MERLTQIQQINSAIMFGTFTNTELNSIVSAVQYARTQLGKEKIRSFTKGDTVKFHSTKRGVTVTGTVTKVAIKYVTVKDGVMLWKVPANMLEAA
jgi:LysM repeat protein